MMQDGIIAKWLTLSLFLYLLLRATRDNLSRISMKRQVITLLLAILALTATQAQQISVVTSSGATNLYSTLQEAIEGAAAGSVIYLPGGGFPIADEVKITKKVTIIGIGHKTRNENVDGNTIIGGNLWFNQGSSGSAVMGCYISGNVNIGEDEKVDNILVKLCNLNGIQVHNSECKGLVVNQNYIRGDNNYGNATDVTISNNITSQIFQVASGTIKNNIICYGGNGNYHRLLYVNRSIINNNIINNEGISYDYIHYGSDCQTSHNYLVNGGSWGDDPVIIEGATVNNLFENLNGWAVNPMSNFHFTDDYEQYETQVGIYAGTGFDDKQLPPTPYIVAKVIPENTDAEGKLNIKVRVKAAE